MTIVLDNISQLIVVPPGPLRGAAMRSVSILENAALLLDAGRIAWFGKAGDVPAGPYESIIDAKGGIVVPGLIDCHTHVVFAGARADEFVRRIEGATYLEILEAGGGIRDSMRKLRAASIEELVEQSLPRLNRMIEWGATTVEVKSGYGLSPEHELKMLRAIRGLAGRTAIEIVSTFLGAHTVPPEFEGRPDEFIDAITDEAMFAEIRDGGLAEFADVFCERGAFTVEQSRRYLGRCKHFGMTPKIHSEQITFTGATKMAVEQRAASADHLERVDEETIAALKNSNTIPVVLPGCSFFLNSDVAPARRMIDAGLSLALATDCNPGSCMIESLPLIMSIAATKLRMTPMECLVACTANAAAALQREDRLGAISVGHQADLLVLDLPSLNHWAYQVGVNPVSKVIKAGKVILERD
ncbi:MAG TPA: imidazolonepropionase [Phycisphaerae bacterium]|nr:imidazolonepropionase [Phycisphaerae bacterium]